MTAPSHRLTCPRCGLEANVVHAEPRGPNRVEILKSFEGHCALKAPDKVSSCPALNREINSTLRRLSGKR